MDFKASFLMNVIEDLVQYANQFQLDGDWHVHDSRF